MGSRYDVLENHLVDGFLESVIVAGVLDALQLGSREVVVQGQDEVGRDAHFLLKLPQLLHELAHTLQLTHTSYPLMLGLGISVSTMTQW